MLSCRRTGWWMIVACQCCSVRFPGSWMILLSSACVCARGVSCTTLSGCCCRHAAAACAPAEEVTGASFVSLTWCEVLLELLVLLVLLAGRRGRRTRSWARPCLSGRLAGARARAAAPCPGLALRPSHRSLAPTP